MPYIYFEKEHKTVACNSGVNLRKLAKKNGIQIYSGIHILTNCRGHGLCGSCEVEIIDAPQVHPRTRMEEVKLDDKPIERRLACQVFVHGNMTVRTHPPTWEDLPEIEEIALPQPDEAGETEEDAAVAAASP